MSPGPTFTVQGLPCDDWPGNDMPGRSWGMGSRVTFDGRVGIVCSAISNFDTKRWDVGIRFEDGSVHTRDELAIDLQNPPKLDAL